MSEFRLYPFRMASITFFPADGVGAVTVARALRQAMSNFDGLGRVELVETPPAYALPLPAKESSNG
jgi:hypothetical protein